MYLIFNIIMAKEKTVMKMFVIHTEWVLVMIPYATQHDEQMRKLISIINETPSADLVLYV